MRSAASLARGGCGCLHNPHSLGCGPHCCIILCSSFFQTIQDAAQERLACFLGKLLSKPCIYLQVTSTGLHNASQHHFSH